ncbi:MAG: 2OG-Fe(II) oxygenase [Oceanicaulis sp.]|nr:2OG-Fe(II) oxygenase [Oceanicaulis sp.]
MAQPLRLNRKIDLSAPARSYGEAGYAIVNAVLDAGSAQRLRDTAGACREWSLVTVIEGQHREFVSAEMERLDPARRTAFEALVAREARSGFCYLYDQLNIYERGRRGTLDDPGLAAAAALIASDAFIDLGRRLTSDPDIRFADCQLTRYRPGHFLTAHDDFAAGKDRSAAFVLNLTDDWCADFGGVLQLLDTTGDVRAGLTPRFNRLTLFKVPQPHAVSVVAPYAPGPRLAITGWFRRDPEPAI